MIVFIIRKMIPWMMILMIIYIYIYIHWNTHAYTHDARNNVKEGIFNIMIPFSCAYTMPPVVVLRAGSWMQLLCGGTELRLSGCPSGHEVGPDTMQPRGGGGSGRTGTWEREREEGTRASASPHTSTSSHQYPLIPTHPHTSTSSPPHWVSYRGEVLWNSPPPLQRAMMALMMS